MSDNLALWNAVEKTPTAHTKPITGKSYNGTSPKPYYLVQKATETFGPCGIGWGFHILDERIEEGAGGERMHIARVRVWYKWNGETGEVEHIGGTSFSGTRASGKTYTDEDAPKKSVTDALIKALSMIGFAGDIFMGRYDDSKYVADLKAEERGEPAKAPQPARQQGPAINPAFVVKGGKDADEWVAKILALIANATSDQHVQAINDANRPALDKLAVANKAKWDTVMRAMNNRTTDLMGAAA